MRTRRNLREIADDTQCLWEIKEVPCSALHTSNTLNNVFSYLLSTVDRARSSNTCTHAMACGSTWHLTILSAVQLSSKDGDSLAATLGLANVTEGRWEHGALIKTWSSLMPVTSQRVNFLRLAQGLTAKIGEFPSKWFIAAQYLILVTLDKSSH